MTNVQTYVRAEGPPNPAFGEQLDEETAQYYAYYGWLPLQLAETPDGGGTVAVEVGDDWLTRPAAGAKPPEAGPVDYPITAADAAVEIHARSAAGLAYFGEETPEERDATYDRDQMATEISNKLQPLLRTLQQDNEALEGLRTGEVDHLDIQVGEIVARTSQNKEVPLAPEELASCRRGIVDYMKAHHADLVHYLHERIRATRSEIAKTLYAGHRLNVFCD